MEPEGKVRILTFTKNRFVSCLSRLLSSSYATQEQCVLLSHESLLKREPRSSAYQCASAFPPLFWRSKAQPKLRATAGLACLTFLRQSPFAEYLEGRGPGPKPTGNIFTSLATPVCQRQGLWTGVFSCLYKEDLPE